MERAPAQQTEKKKKKGVRACFKPVVLTDTADLPGCSYPQDPSGLKQKKIDHRQGQFLSLYNVGTKIGAGVFGTVYMGTRRSDRLKVAIKFIQMDPNDIYVKIPGHDKDLLKEVALNLLVQKPEKCPNIVETLDWFIEDGKHVLILEYPCPCETLEEFIKSHSRGCLRENQARDLMHQAVKAAKHCIDHNVFHADIHDGNILINTQTKELKLIDFGISHLISSDSGCKERTEAVSMTINSLGTLLLSMTIGTNWKIEDLRAVRHPTKEDYGLSEECRDLINRCIYAPPTDRPTLEEILDHKWFKLS